MPNEEVMLKDLPVGAQIQPRVAKALSGMEVAAAIGMHVGQIAKQFASAETAEALAQGVTQKLLLDSRFNKEHLTYPKICWEGEIWDAQQSERPAIHWSVRIYQNTTSPAIVVGSGVSWIEGGATPYPFGQGRTDRPDEIRRRFAIPLKAMATMPGTGQTITVILPGDTVMSEGGHPTAAAKRMAELRAQHVAQQPRTAPPSPQGGVPASELVAEPPVPGASQSGAPGSIAKPVPRAALGKPKR